MSASDSHVRELMGHKTALRVTCEQLVDETTLAAFLRSVRCSSLAQACRSIFDGSEQQLVSALVSFEKQGLAS